MPNPSLPERLYRSLYRIRRVEQEVCRVYPTDRIISPVHLSIGQEGVSVAVCDALQPADVVFGSYRCHALYLAKGGDLNRMVAELYGRSDGCAKGKAGSMHLIDRSVGVMGASAVVATQIPQAVGYAMALRRKGIPAVVACFLGDGAVEEGVFHESVNFAALQRLPVLFVCENNFYAIHSALSARQSAPGIAELVRGHGIPAERIEDPDAAVVRDRIAPAVEAIRSGASGPQFFECLCYRWMEHVGPGQDFEMGYRGRREAEPWLQRDPVALAAARLDPAVRQGIEGEVEAEIRAAFEAAERGSPPPAEELFADLYEPNGEVR